MVIFKRPLSSRKDNLKCNSLSPGQFVLWQQLEKSLVRSIQHTYLRNFQVEDGPLLHFERCFWQLTLLVLPKRMS